MGQDWGDFYLELRSGWNWGARERRRRSSLRAERETLRNGGKKRMLPPKVVTSVAEMGRWILCVGSCRSIKNRRFRLKYTVFFLVLFCYSEYFIVSTMFTRQLQYIIFCNTLFTTVNISLFLPNFTTVPLLSRMVHTRKLAFIQ